MSFAWNKAQLTSATVKSLLGVPCGIRAKGLKGIYMDDRQIPTSPGVAGSLAFDTEKGRCYTLDFGNAKSTTGEA